MARTYWHKQTTEAPLFPDLLWSRPENRRFAGKLLIVGGNAQGFAVPAAAHQASLKAGIGVTKILLPDAVRKIIGTSFLEAEFAPSTPSGSFARRALQELTELASWADATLMAGEFGRNSETTIMLESFLSNSNHQVCLTRDTVDYFANPAFNLLNRQNTLLVLSIGQLQKLCQQARSTIAITHGMDLLQLVDSLHSLTTEYPCHIVVKHLQTMIVASGGLISTTKLTNDPAIWRVETAAKATVWWLQNPSKPFKALASAGL